MVNHIISLNVSLFKTHFYKFDENAPIFTGYFSNGLLKPIALTLMSFPKINNREIF
jgi:hypothetical protein